MGERETAEAPSTGKTSDDKRKPLDDSRRLSVGHDLRQSAFAIELAFDLVATVANRLDRTFHIVFRNLLLVGLIADFVILAPSHSCAILVTASYCFRHRSSPHVEED